MADEGGKDVAPLNPNIVKDISEIVSKKEDEASVKAGIEPLGSEAIAESEEIIKKEEQKGPLPSDYFVNEFDRDPLPTREREIIRVLYQNLRSVLPLVTDDANLKVYGRFEFLMNGKILHFFGVPGKFGIFAGTQTEDRDKNGHLVKIKAREWIRIERELHDKKGETYYEWYTVTSDGLGYGLWPEIDREGNLIKKKEKNYEGKNVSRDIMVEGRVGKDAEGNSRELSVIKRSSDLINAIVDSVNNPELSIEGIRAKVKETRSVLMSYFRSQGVVPKWEDATYTQTKEEADYDHLLGNLFKAAGGKPKEQAGPRTFKYKLPQVYDTRLGSVQFSRDVGFDSGPVKNSWRARREFQSIEEEAHGLGIVINGDDYYAQERDKMASERNIMYALWENGDAYMAKGQITEGMGLRRGETMVHIRDPHEVYIECMKLQSNLKLIEAREKNPPQPSLKK